MSTTSELVHVPQGSSAPVRMQRDASQQYPVSSLSHILQGRRDYLTGELERICHRFVRPRILSVSNGLLREAESVLPLCARRSGEFVAFDANTDTLEALGHEYGPANIRCAHHLDSGSLGQFHYIYVLNRLNEIQRPEAARLLTKLAAMLHKGGSLLASNFTPALQSLGYTEGILWKPVYRAEAEMIRLADKIPESDLMSHLIWRDETDTIVYLEVQR